VECAVADEQGADLADHVVDGRVRPEVRGQPRPASAHSAMSVTSPVTRRAAAAAEVSWP